MITPYFRPANPAVTSLETGDVHLWRHRFGQSGPCLAEDVGVLSKAELKRADKVTNRDRQARVIESRVVLRYLLAGYLDTQPAAVKIRKGKLGRPELNGKRSDRTFSFNLSHSGDLLLLAAVRDSKIGVDVEQVRERPEIDKLVQRVFSDNEQAMLGTTAKEQRLQAFFRGWTRKEALLKSDGEGVFRKARETEVSLSDVYQPQIYQFQGSRERAKELSLLTFQPEDQAVGALAVAHGNWRIRYFSFEAGVFNSKAG
jgi:4'-phosphopantetheinyl transferase